MSSDPRYEQLEAALRPLQLLQRLDSGGMGEIFLARDPMLRRTVAVKVLRSEFARSGPERTRFFREAEAIAGIAHPNVIGIHAVAELPDGTPFFVMDYVTGSSLAHRLERDGPMTVREARAVLAQVASALAAAHARGVVHRDIKAQNILFDADTGRALVTDFGVAAFHANALVPADGRLTTTGAWVGSPAYMSPEQFLGETVTPAADVYALGLLAYDLLLAHGPFEHTSPQRLLVAHVSETPKPLQVERSDVDPELDAVVQRCLLKQPDARPTAEEVALLLAPGGTGMIEWPPPLLDGVRGAAYPLARRVGGAALFLLGPLLAAASVRSFSVGTTSEILWAAAVLLSLGLGVFVAARTIATFGLLLRDVRRASTLGYRTGTLAEVFADWRGDTGHLIAGMREYTGLAAAERGALRTRRVLAAACALTGAMLLPLTIPLGIAIAARTGQGWLVLLLGLAPTLACALAAATFAERERRLVAKARRGMAETPRAAAAPLVPQWYAAAERLSRGVGVPAGPSVPRAAITAAVAGGVLVVVTILMVAGAVGVVVVLGRLQGSRLGGMERAEAKAARIEEFAYLALPIDSSITPAGARAAYVAATTDSIWRSPRLPDSIIAGSSLLNANLFPAPYRLDATAAIPRAFAGLTRSEQRYLEGFGGDPAAPALSILARAPRMSGLMPDVIDSTTLIWAIPIPRFSPMREAAYRRLAVAALLISEGRTDSAEVVLRETYSAGLRLTRDSNTLIESLLGTVIAGIGLRGLAGLYTETGRREEAQRILASLDDPADDADQTPLYATTPSGEEETLRAVNIVADTTALRALRWELLGQLEPLSACHDVRGLMRGPPEQVQTALAAARASLVRDSADAALYRAVVEHTDRIYRYGPRVGEYDLLIGNLRRAVRAAAAVLRTPRLDACFVILTGN